jgi:hypothetical protein
MSNTPESMTNETEVLRIEGNVTVPKFQATALKSIFESWIAYNEFLWSGNIVPQDSPTGMRLYRVEEVEGYKEKIITIEGLLLDERVVNKENDKLTLSLSEELSKEREALNRYREAYALAFNQNTTNVETINDQALKIQALEKRLELAENNRWRTFIKWWNNLWKH